MPNENRLIDTNVLVYAYDISDRRRHPIAQHVVDDIWDAGGGAVTLQNVAEFYVIVTDKVQAPIPADTARTIVEDIMCSSRWFVMDRGAQTLVTAMKMSGERRAHLWDALIAASMIEHGITTIVTENERDFNKIPGIKVVNPFK